jgi:hypothetical protein
MLPITTKYPDDFPDSIIKIFNNIVKPFIERKFKGLTVKAFLEELKEYQKNINSYYMTYDFQEKRTEILNKLAEAKVQEGIIKNEIEEEFEIDNWYEAYQEKWQDKNEIEEQNDSLEKKIKQLLNDNPLWKPGTTPVTDLRSFLYLLPKDENNELTIEGKKAFDLFKEYEKNFDETKNGIFKKYEKVNPFLNMNNALAFLKNVEKEIKLIENNKTITYECSSFSYSAIGYLMLIDDEIRKNYDILQIGIMESKGRYLHNIAVLIPKGTEPTMYGQLPEGSLIVDPWARALGHPADQTLGVTPEDYYFNDFLYPMMANYHSGAEADLEKTCTDFIEAFEEKTEKMIKELNIVKKFLEEYKDKIKEFKEKKVKDFIGFFEKFSEELTEKTLYKEFFFVKKYLESFKEKNVKAFLNDFEENYQKVSKMDSKFMQRTAQALETLEKQTEESKKTSYFNKSINMYIKNGR